jgi:hypothetical protein
MRIVHHLDVLLRQLDASDFDGMPAAQRHRIAEQFRRAAALAAQRRPDPPPSGVLSGLWRGMRAE